MVNCKGLEKVLCLETDCTWVDKKRKFCRTSKNKKTKNSPESSPIKHIKIQRKTIKKVGNKKKKTNRKNLNNLIIKKLSILRDSELKNHGFYKVKAYEIAINAIKTDFKDIPLTTGNQLNNYNGIGIKTINKIDEIIQTSSKNPPILNVMSYNILGDCWVNWFHDFGSYYWKFNLPDPENVYKYSLITKHREQWKNILSKPVRRPIILEKLRVSMEMGYIICLQELEVDNIIPDLKKHQLNEGELIKTEHTYIEELCQEKNYKIFHGWNKTTETWAHNGCAICISNDFIDKAITREITVVNESSGTTALILEIIKNDYQYLFISSHMDRGSQDTHINSIINKLNELSNNDKKVVIVWCGDFNTNCENIIMSLSKSDNTKNIKELTATNDRQEIIDFKTQYLRKDDTKFPDAIRADHILSNIDGEYDMNMMHDYNNIEYNQINEEYLAQDTLMKYGSDHKPEYAIIQLQ